MWASRQLHQGSQLSCDLEDASGAWQPVEWLAEGVGDPVHHPGGVARLLQQDTWAMVQGSIGCGS